MMNNILIFGSRSITDERYVYDHLSTHTACITGNIRFISGGAKGVDTLCKQYAKVHGIKLKEFLPDYNKYGQRAPLIRNTQMAKECDWGICFWDGVSRGTLYTIKEMVKLGKQAIVYGKPRGKIREVHING